MKKLKLIGITLASATLLTACSQQSDMNEKVTSFKGGGVTVSDIYNEAKKQDTTSQIVYNMTVSQIFDNEYGDKVSDKDVKDTVANYKDQYESEKEFKAAIKQNGFTEKEFEKYIKQQLAYEKGIKEHIKVSDADLKKAYKIYMPDQTIDLMAFSDKKIADEVAKEVNKDNFEELAKSKSELADQGIDYTLTSTDASVPAEIREKIYKLKAGEVSEVMEYKDETLGATAYFIVKVDNPKKKESLDTYKKELKELIVNEKFADQNTVNKIVKDVLAKNNFKLNDEDFKAAFDAVVKAN